MQKNIQSTTYSGLFEQINQGKIAAVRLVRMMGEFYKQIVTSVRSAIASWSTLPTIPTGPLNTPYVNAVLSRLCNDDPATLQWVLRWIAYPLRNPGAKMSTALWIGGGQGTGKGLIFGNLFGAMHGDRFRTISGDDLNRNFNQWASEKRYVLVEDGKNALAQNIKYLITSHAIAIRAKTRHPRYERNEMNFVFLSQDWDALPADVGDRRFMVIEPGKRLAEGYYRAAADEIQRGGLEQFYQFLMWQLDMGDFDINTPAPGKREEQ